MPGKTINKIPLREKLWESDPSTGETKLIGSKCDICGEIYFPIKDKGWCVHCQKYSLKDLFLSREGRIYSFSIVHQQPGGGFYKGSIPYAYGYVDLPEGVRIVASFASDYANFDDLKIGQKVQLVLDRLCDDGNNEITTFKFKPINQKDKL